MVKATRIEVLDRVAGKPAPEPLEISEAMSRNPLNGAFVEIPGLVVKVLTNGLNTVPFMRHRAVITLKKDGSTIRLVAPNPSSSPVSEESLEQPRRDEETILVIEDEASVRDVFSRTLSSFGYEVLTAEDGPAARKAWADHGARVDLVLTDLVMPNGMSGFDVARELRAQRADLKVVCMSGHSSELLELGGSLIPGVDFLAKPFQPSDLVRLVRSRLDSN